jgi:hypothetical protein
MKVWGLHKVYVEEEGDWWRRELRTKKRGGAHLKTCGAKVYALHQGREIIAIGALENGAFCTVFSENFHKF